jgi:hypothetical protein
VWDWCFAVRDSKPSSFGHPTCESWKVHSSTGFHFKPGIEIAMMAILADILIYDAA